MTEEESVTSGDDFVEGPSLSSHLGKLGCELGRGRHPSGNGVAVLRRGEHSNTQGLGTFHVSSLSVTPILDLISESRSCI